MILSPITTNNNIRVVDVIRVKDIIAIYKRILPEIDPKYLFKDYEEIKVYECNESKYRFYWPFDISGDDNYYSKLGDLPWYYSPWKWEHQAALNHINQHDKVLEVGAAKGDFIKKITEIKKVEGIGLELSSEAIINAKKNNVKILNESIQDHAIKNRDVYDVVCTFQVLEHISDVKSFIESMIGCLKPNGKLIISVPNNDSFVGINQLDSKVLNQPPHHMGLWNATSLKNLENFFEIKLLNFEYEPLQPSHYQTYLMNRLYKIFKSKLLVNGLWKLGLTNLFKTKILKDKETIIGHSINAYFQKVSK